MENLLLLPLLLIGPNLPQPISLHLVTSILWSLLIDVVNLLDLFKKKQDPMHVRHKTCPATRPHQHKTPSVRNHCLLRRFFTSDRNSITSSRVAKMFSNSAAPKLLMSQSSQPTSAEKLMSKFSSPAQIVQPPYPLKTNLMNSTKNQKNSSSMTK